MQHARHHAAAAVMLLAATALSGCTKPAEPPPTEQSSLATPPYRSVASIREVMNSIIDPNADVVWNAVKTVIDHGKPTEHSPASDEEWAAVRRGALIVAEGANLLMMPARPVAPAGAGSLAPGIELAPDEVRALIEQNPAGWNQFARALQDAMTPAIAAIDKKDAQALFEVGDEIDAVCESCHQVFWFPNAVTAAQAR